MSAQLPAIAADGTISPEPWDRTDQLPEYVDRRVDPNQLGEASELIDWLHYQRASVLLKLAGLSPEQLVQRPVPGSNLSLLGLVRHLNEVEQYWAFQIGAGNADAPNPYGTEEDVDADFNGASADRAFEDLVDYGKIVAEANNVWSGLVLDEVLPALRRNAPVNTRWVLLHLIEEYARHLGHLDLIREMIDGRTGD